MWFRKLNVVNVGPFEKLSLDMTRGSIGVFGRNGKGKSTILNLLYGLATNDFSRFDGLKSDMIRNTAESKAEAYIQGEIEHNGVVLDITRNFKPTPSRKGTVLVCDGETITDANKAQAEVYKRLGVDGKMLDLYVFKSQDRIYDFLTTIPSERAKAYAALCRTEACEKAWNVLGDFLNKDKEVNSGITDNSDELTQEIAELLKELNDLSVKKEEAAKDLCEDKFLKRYESQVKAQQRLEHLRTEETKAAADVSLWKTTYASHKEAAATRKETLDTWQGKVDKSKAAADDKRAALKSWEAYRKNRKRRKELKDEADELAQAELKNKPPEANTDADKLEVWRKKVMQLESRLETATKIVKLFQETGRSECPTCGTSVEHLGAHLAEMQNAVNSLPAEITALDAKIEKAEQYKEAARKYERWRAAHDARVLANQTSRLAMSNVVAPEEDADELQAFLDKFTATEVEAKKAQQASTQWSNLSIQTLATLDAKKARLSEIRQEIEEISVEPEKVEKARKRLAEHSVALNVISQLEGEAKGSQKLYDVKEAELKKLRVKLKRDKRLRKMVKVVEAARDVLHRDRLPRRVAKINLMCMEGDINEHLKKFGDPFSVEADEELSFSVSKPGEPPQPAGRLSTGQRVVLALAFWPSVASLWSSELGMLALDEPTANLDAENRKLLREALSAMTAKVRGERQLIMVTHDPDLRTAFDQVIDLGG